jgi:hypothetical protein
MEKLMEELKSINEKLKVISEDTVRQNLIANRLMQEAYVIFETIEENFINITTLSEDFNENLERISYRRSS